MRLYEGMFIVTNDLAAEGWEKVEETVTELITRFGGEIVRLRKWADRHFAYPINKQTSGVYVLTHFNTDPQSIVKMENRVQISAEFLRVLITTLDPAYAEESYSKEPGEESAIRMGDSDFDDDDDSFRPSRGHRKNSEEAKESEAKETEDADESETKGEEAEAETEETASE